MMGSTTYVSVATALAEDASIGMDSAGLLGHDTNGKRLKVAIRQIISIPIFSSDTGIAGQ
jgi:hypothetical protein